jgi:hypothetical protein
MSCPVCLDFCQKKTIQGHFGFRKKFFRWNFSLSHRVKSNLQLLDNDQNSEKNGGRERSDGGDFLARTRPHIKIYLITFTFGYGSRWSAPAGGRCPRLVGRAAASERTTTACRPVHAWHWTARRGAFGGRSLVRSRDGLWRSTFSFLSLTISLREIRVQPTKKIETNEE